MKPFGGSLTRELKLVWVEQHPLVSKAIRIFKSRRAAFASQVFVVEMIRSIAVGDVRHAVWLRCKGDCEDCASPVTEESGHMHERKHRGKGGEVSVANSVFICEKCHKHAHRARNPRWKKGLDKAG